MYITIQANTFAQAISRTSQHAKSITAIKSNGTWIITYFV